MHAYVYVPGWMVSAAFTYPVVISPLTEAMIYRFSAFLCEFIVAATTIALNVAWFPIGLLISAFTVIQTVCFSQPVVAGPLIATVLYPLHVLATVRGSFGPQSPMMFTRNFDIDDLNNVINPSIFFLPYCSIYLIQIVIIVLAGAFTVGITLGLGLGFLALSFICYFPLRYTVGHDRCFILLDKLTPSVATIGASCGYALVALAMLILCVLWIPFGIVFAAVAALYMQCFSQNVDDVQVIKAIIMYPSLRLRSIFEIEFDVSWIFSHLKSLWPKGLDKSRLQSGLLIVPYLLIKFVGILWAMLSSICGQVVHITLFISLSPFWIWRGAKDNLESNILVPPTLLFLVCWGTLIIAAQLIWLPIGLVAIILKYMDMIYHGEYNISALKLIFLYPTVLLHHEVFEDIFMISILRPLDTNLKSLHSGFVLIPFLVIALLDVIAITTCFLLSVIIAVANYLLFLVIFFIKCTLCLEAYEEEGISGNTSTPLYQVICGSTTSCEINEGRDPHTLVLGRFIPRCGVTNVFDECTITKDDKVYRRLKIERGWITHSCFDIVTGELLVNLDFVPRRGWHYLTDVSVTIFAKSWRLTSRLIFLVIGFLWLPIGALLIFYTLGFTNRSCDNSLITMLVIYPYLVLESVLSSCHDLFKISKSLHVIAFQHPADDRKLPWPVMFDAVLTHPEFLERPGSNAKGIITVEDTIEKLETNRARLLPPQIDLFSEYVQHEVSSVCAANCRSPENSYVSPV